jgi:hypothetical protein
MRAAALSSTGSLFVFFPRRGFATGFALFSDQRASLDVKNSFTK